MPISDEVIINASRMNRILDFDEVSGILVCEAGAIHQILMSGCVIETTLCPWIGSWHLSNRW